MTIRYPQTTLLYASVSPPLPHVTSRILLNRDYTIAWCGLDHGLKYNIYFEDGPTYPNHHPHHFTHKREPSPHPHVTFSSNNSNFDF